MCTSHCLNSRQSTVSGRDGAASGLVEDYLSAAALSRQTRPKIPDFVGEFKIGFPVWVGGSTMDLEDLKLGQALPATAFLDKEGHIAARVLGQVSKDELRERLDWLTGDRKGPAPNPLVRHVSGN
jgi:hypothetical protein